MSCADICRMRLENGNCPDKGKPCSEIKECLVCHACDDYEACKKRGDSSGET